MLCYCLEILVNEATKIVIESQEMELEPTKKIQKNFLGNSNCKNPLKFKYFLADQHLYFASQCPTLDIHSKF